MFEKDKEMTAAIHPRKTAKEIWHVHAPCTDGKPFVFYNRVGAFAKYDRLCVQYGTENCRIENV